jgi:hypothetical protein
MTETTNVLTEFKKLFPEIEEPGTRGGIIRECVHDALCRLIHLRWGERPATAYHATYSHDPLKGLQSDADRANELLSLIELRRIYLKKVPRVSTADLQAWFIPPETATQS